MKNCALHKVMCFSIVVFLLFLVGLAWAKPIQIRLLRKAVISSENVTLGRIADLECQDQELKRKLKLLKITRVRVPGQSLYVHANQVSSALSKIDLKKSDYNLIAKAPVKVTRKYATVTSDMISKAVRKFIARKAPWKSSQLKVASVHCTKIVRVPKGKVSFKLTAPKKTDWLGAVAFNVLIKVDGKTVRKLSATATIQVWSNVVFSAKPLGKDQPLKSSDVIIKKANLAAVPTGAVLKKKDVIGKRPRRAVAANSILRMNQFKKRHLIHKGDVVQVIAESGLLRIATQAKARENGEDGERIRIENLSSKKIVYATVMDAHTVKVDF
ncbi:MAG: flagellar basal body P-ring formation protein FlgA [Desulfobacteraceae bacterium]|nr:flagellar basal body P-ring formation protein FlgA [Desulfobacteraceae bacterium]